MEFISGDVTQLWGGVALTSKATKEQIINFFLTIYQSFLRPIILIRLLLHRLSTPNNDGNPFNWSNESSHVTSYTILPTHMAVLTLIGRWLESFPDDFICFPELLTEIDKVVKRVKLTRGPFIPHAHRLRSLVADVSRPRSKLTNNEIDNRNPHHNNLYTLVSLYSIVQFIVHVLYSVSKW